jgi:hypothetical protein
MSASDWIRMKRLEGARTNAYSYSANGVSASGVLTTNKDIAPPQSNQLEVHNINGAINVFPVVGTSKIRRPASNWTDYVASQTADYLTYSQGAVNTTSVVRTQTKLCGCRSTVLNTKTGICTECNQTTHVRIM